VERIWENTAASLHMSTPVLLDGKVYGLSRMKSGHLFCLDASTGETSGRVRAGLPRTPQA